MDSVLEPQRFTCTVQNNGGDTPITWTAGDPDQEEDARRRFDFYKGKGYRAYEDLGRGRQGREITTFDPQAGNLIMRKQMVGG